MLAAQRDRPRKTGRYALHGGQPTTQPSGCGALHSGQVFCAACTRTRALPRGGVRHGAKLLILPCPVPCSPPARPSSSLASTWLWAGTIVSYCIRADSD